MLRDINPSTEQSILTVLNCSEGQCPLPVYQFLPRCGGLTSAGHHVPTKLFITLPSQQDLSRNTMENFDGQDKDKDIAYLLLIWAKKTQL